MPADRIEKGAMSWKPQREELRKPYYQCLADRLEKDVVSGVLPQNTRLPQPRELAGHLGLTPGIVTRAYNLCEQKGLICAVEGKGTFVARGISAGDTDHGRNGPVIPMGMIRPFYECNQSVLTAASQVLGGPESVRLFEYGPPSGTGRQIDAALKWLHYFGIEAAGEQILITAGAQNALAVILLSLFGAGDVIAVDAFTYANFRKLADSLNVRLLPVEADEHGMSPEALSQACRNAEVKGLYLMPTCSNPTGIFMPAFRRQEIADIVSRFHLLLIEDDIYSFMTPNGVKPFFSILPEQTVHICSISKSLCAGLRVAFLAFPAKYGDALSAGMINVNLKTASLNREIVAELIESGAALNIVQKKIALVQKRSQIFRSVFELPEEDNIARFFFWLQIPNHLTSEEVELLALRRGVRVLGSHRFAMNSGQKSDHIRVAIVSPDTEEDLRKGLMILKGIFGDNTAGIFV